jgi:hypothetical protein
MMNQRERTALTSLIESAQRHIQVADDELDQGDGSDMELVRGLVERVKQHCEQALRLLPSPNGG